MSSAAILNLQQVNQAVGNNIRQSQNADVDVIAVTSGHSHWGYHPAHHGGNVQTNVVQQNAASGNNINQVQNADVDVTAITSGWGHLHHGGNVQTNVIQQNAASGNNIGQFQNADVDVVAVNSGHWGYHPAHHSGGNVQTNVGQFNQASGNNIQQAQNADVDVTAFTGGWGNLHHGGGNVQTNVTQVNQASGNNITQFQNADVDVVAIGRSFGWGRLEDGGAQSTTVADAGTLAQGQTGTGETSDAFAQMSTFAEDVVTTVMQANQAAGDGIAQVQSADVDVLNAMNTFADAGDAAQWTMQSATMQTSNGEGVVNVTYASSEVPEVMSFTVPV